MLKRTRAKYFRADVFLFDDDDDNDDNDNEEMIWKQPVPNYTSIRNVLVPAGAKITSAGFLWTASGPKEMSI